MPPWLERLQLQTQNKLEISSAGDIGQKHFEDFGREKQNKFETEMTTHRDSITCWTTSLRRRCKKEK